MSNLRFKQLNQCFKNNDFSTVEKDHQGIRFFKLRSMSRKGIIEEFCKIHNIDISSLKSKDYFEHIFKLNTAADNKIDKFIKQEYEKERALRKDNEDYLIDQLNRLQHFDWGGSYGNSLEKNIVNNYVKKNQSYERINKEIEGNLLSSLRGYTLNSWYNHWTSILIEDVFKDHEKVLPTVGLVKKIDFFINNVPFDLKVTYFPEALLSHKLKLIGYGNELTMLKKICRHLEIYIPTDVQGKPLKMHLYNKVSENLNEDAKKFIKELNEQKKNIISEAKKDPTELKKWFYENQGEARFDASNRFFLVLTDESNMANSWKVKRNILFLRKEINEHLNNLSVMNMPSLNTEFFWKKDEKTYHCKSDILFLTY